jgi:hypothetical protein
MRRRQPWFTLALRRSILLGQSGFNPVCAKNEEASMGLPY